MQQISTTLVAISRYTLFRAKQEILACQACDVTAGTPFRLVLDFVTDNCKTRTNYIMSEAVKCPQCFGPVFEETLVAWAEEEEGWED